MAKSDLTVNIGSKFNKEGFNKLEQSVKSASGKVGKLGSTVGKLTQELGSIGGAAGKAAGAVSGVVSGFMSMGVAGVVIAGGTLAIEGLFKWLNRTNDALAEMAEKFKGQLKNAINSVKNEIEKLSKIYDGFISKNKLFGERRDNVANGQLARMELDKKDALRGKSGAEAARIELEWTKKIEKFKEEQSKKHLKDVEYEIKMTKKQLEEAERKSKGHKEMKAVYLGSSLKAFRDGDQVLGSQMNDKWRLEDAQAKKYDERAEELKKKLEELETKRLKGVEDVATAEHNTRTSILDSEQKVSDEMLKEKQAKEKKTLEETEKARKEAEKKALDAKKKADRELIEAEKKKAEAIKKDAAEEVKQADARIKGLDKVIADAQAEIQKLASQRPSLVQSPDEKRAARQAEKEAARQARREASAMGRFKQVEGRVIGKNGIRGGANDSDINALLNGADAIGIENLDDNTQKALAKERARLTELSGYNNRKMSKKQKERLAKLNSLFAGEDAKKKAEDAKKEKEQIEKEKAENEKKRTKALEDIDIVIKKIQENMGI